MKKYCSGGGVFGYVRRFVSKIFRTRARPRSCQKRTTLGPLKGHFEWLTGLRYEVTIGRASQIVPPIKFSARSVEF